MSRNAGKGVRVYLIITGISNMPASAADPDGSVGAAASETPEPAGIKRESVRGKMCTNGKSESNKAVWDGSRWGKKH
jgi:hypothetical protein